MGRARKSSIELTERQREVLRLVARGHTNGGIGEILGISLAGAKWHVSELMTKLDAATREELAECYLADRQLSARLGRWWSGVLGALTLKPVALAGIAVVGGLAAAGAIVATMRAWGGSDTEHQEAPAVAGITAVALTPTPEATGQTTFVTGDPRADWTAVEALAKAEQAVRDDFASNPNSRIVAGTFRVTTGRWLSQAVGVPAGDPDGDYNWSPQDGVPTDVWLFSWDIPGSTVADYSRPLTFHVTVILKDGGDGKALAIWEDFGKPAGVNGLTGHVSGFRSQRGDADLVTRLTDRAPVGPAVTFGWYNDAVNGAAWLEAFPAGGGYWCVLGRDFAGGGNGDWCQSDDDPRNPPLRSRLSTTFSASGEMGDATLFVDAVPAITRLKALPGDGRELEFQTYAPPAQSAITRRFAWITIGTIAGGYTLIGYDAAGNEIARAGSTAPGPPPPPPSRMP